MVKEKVASEQIKETSREILGTTEELRLLEEEKAALPPGDARAARLSREVKKLAGDLEDAADREEELSEDIASRDRSLGGHLAARRQA